MRQVSYFDYIIYTHKSLKIITVLHAQLKTRHKKKPHHYDGAFVKIYEYILRELLRSLHLNLCFLLLDQILPRHLL